MTCLRIVLLCCSLLAPAASAQQILVDQGVRVAGVWCFPSASDPTQWYYVPQTARLALDGEGKPSFSFLRYVVNEASAEATSEGITQARGGGIITLIATYDTPADVVAKAAKALEEVAGGEEPVVLRGPIIFESGRYMLVSAILREDGENETSILATGSAPVFEGNAVAFSFDVDADRATLLLESFKMATPDVSIVFEMTLVGLSDAYEAVLTVDWERVDSTEAFGAGVDVLNGLASAQIEQGFDEMRKSDAIVIETRGASPNMEALLNKVHERLLAMMFTRVAPERIDEPAEQEQGAGAGGIIEGLLGGIQKLRDDPVAATKALPAPWSITASYEKKEFRKTGKSRIQLNHQSPVERQVTLVANVGDLFSRFGKDSNYFRTVNLADPAFQQREIHLGIDGAIQPEFKKYINSVAITLRKKHQNGQQTVRELVIDARTFDRDSRDFRMIYGWNGDEDRNAWLSYDYRARWSFKGGGLHETGWTTTTSNMIDLYAPYRRSTVELIANPDRLREQKVRAVSVIVEYDFFDGRRIAELSVHELEELDGKELELTLPHNIFGYDYEITWIRRGLPPANLKGKDDTGVVFVDELPVEPDEPTT